MHRNKKLFVLLMMSALLLITIAIAVTNDEAQAQALPAHLAPDGGGSFDDMPTDRITDALRTEIQKAIKQNIERLQVEGRLAPATPNAVALAWPLKKAAGVTDFHVAAISNYVDQNPAFPNQLLDWNCGNRTYDQSSGYNHAGIDFFTWPFGWKKLDDSSVEIVAAAPGTIIYKTDGNYDRNCSFNNSTWNAVYVRHSDNSVAWYGHMKNGSQTSKQVGDTVAVGEKLGIVGSSGNSTGPHLHFELYDSNNQLKDPFQGACNALNANSWWASQEPYRNPRLNALMTQSAAPVLPNCSTETTNQKTVFQPGEQIVAAGYYRDQLLNQQTQYFLLRPDGSTYDSWSHTSPNTYSASYWFWTRVLPSNGPNGQWTLRAIFNGQTYDTPFIVGVASPFAALSGTVTNSAGQGIRNATVLLVDGAGNRRIVRTNSFGSFSFQDVPTGVTYNMTVAAKRYRFDRMTIEVVGNLTDLNFVGSN